MALSPRRTPADSFDRKLELMAKGVGDKNIITMLLIFLTAGSFVGVVGRSSAESVAYCMLSLIPARLRTMFNCANAWGTSSRAA